MRLLSVELSWFEQMRVEVGWWPFPLTRDAWKGSGSGRWLSQKVSPILFADAVADPLAVVIKGGHASVAVLAVLCAHKLLHVTGLAVPSFHINFAHLTLRWKLVRLLDYPGQGRRVLDLLLAELRSQSFPRGYLIVLAAAVLQLLLVHLGWRAQVVRVRGKAINSRFQSGTPAPSCQGAGFSFLLINEGRICFFGFIKSKRNSCESPWSLKISARRSGGRAV